MSDLSPRSGPKRTIYQVAVSDLMSTRPRLPTALDRSSDRQHSWADRVQHDDPFGHTRRWGARTRFARHGARVDPPALLADDPAASLDMRHRIDVVRRLVRRGTERLCVIMMHDLDLAFRFFERRGML